MATWVTHLIIADAVMNQFPREYESFSVNSYKG